MLSSLSLVAVAAFKLCVTSARCNFPPDLTFAGKDGQEEAAFRSHANKCWPEGLWRDTFLTFSSLIQLYLFMHKCVRAPLSGCTSEVCPGDLYISTWPQPLFKLFEAKTLARN